MRGEIGTTSPCHAAQNFCPRTIPTWLCRFISLATAACGNETICRTQISILSAAYSVQRKVLGEGDPDLFYTLRSLGLTLESEGKLQESERVHREALAGYRKQGDLDDPQAMSEVENLVRVLRLEKKLADAGQFLDEAITPALAAKPSSERMLALRAELRGRAGRWQEAAADAQLAFTYQPTDQGRYTRCWPRFLIEANQRSEYTQLCDQLLQSYGDTTNIYVADQVAKASPCFCPSPI